MSTVLGLDAKLFIGVAGQTATKEMKNVKDVTLNLESGEADITTRAAKGWRMSVATLKEASIEFEMRYDTEDDDFKQISDAYFNGTPLAIFVSDGDGNGLDCDVSVLSFTVNQPLEEAMTASVSVKPTDIGGANSRAPKWVTGGSASSGS